MKPFFLAFCCFLFHVVDAQLNHFVYIQSESGQSFSIKINNKIYSSTASGYLIIPKLVNGDYRLDLGFPKNRYAAQKLQINLKGRDRGFLLKHFGEEGWALFDLQKMDVIKFSAAGSVEMESRVDSFSNKLASAANTPSILQETIMPSNSDEKVKDTIVNAVSVSRPNTDSITAVEQSSIKVDTAGSKTNTATISDSSKPENVLVPSAISEPDTAKQIVYVNQISKLFSASDANGTVMVYVVNGGNTFDTVRLFIPAAKEVAIVKVDSFSTDVKNNIITSDSGQSTKSDTLRLVKDLDVRNLPITEDQVGSAEKKKPFSHETIADSTFTLTILNSNCKSVAIDSDFLKLRKRMAAENDDEGMIAISKKAFRLKCFTTEQIKNLSLLFLNDEGKYHFYDAAYGHVSDDKNFKSLQSMLTDDYYIARFKAMLR